jgi:glycosyltransferase involved in cell wall biosynthesis
LERYYQNYGQFNLNVRDKLNAFRKADFFTCAGQKQRLYFLPWLMQAGFDVACDRYASIPVSLSPQLPSHESTGDLSFVYGGVFLPWQDPSLALSVLVKVLEQREQGQLLLFGGKHPLYPVDTGIFESLKSRLQISSRVSYRTMLARDELIKIYTHAHVAMDLMARNPERELAFTTRTVEYLWCGLPVIYNNYAELSTWIREYNAGWILDPMDANTIQHTIHSIVDRPEKTSERGRNAQQLVYEQLTWDRTIAPLDQFVRAPTKLLRRSHNIAAPALATQAAASANHKTFGQLVDEAILHYRRGGMKTLTCETIGFLKRKLTLR